MFKQMINWITGTKERAFIPLSQVPAGYFSPRSEYNLQLPGRLWHGEQALALSPFFNALRLYQQAAASLPLVTYVKDADGNRERLQDRTTFNILHERPNPPQSRAVFFEKLLHDYWLEGEFFVQCSWANNHRLLGLYPIPARAVKKIDFDSDWKKTYHVEGYDEPLLDDEVIHVINFSRDGLRGVSFLWYAGESLGLHKQILDTATALYQHTPRISGQVVQTAALNKEARDELRTDLKDKFSGSMNAGGVPFMPMGTEFRPIDTHTAESAMIVDALNVSVADIARWFGLSPLLLADLSRGTYSNSAADKLAFYQKNMMPILDKIQLEFNYKLFGAGADTYCEFLTDAILRADPKTQADVWHLGLTDGYLLKSEVREWLNLPAVPGMDTPTAPVNMAPIAAAPDTPTEETPNEDPALSPSV